MKHFFSTLEKRSQIVILLGLVVQIITAITQLGFFHVDQHFQYVEFAYELLGMKNSAHTIWEFNDKIRPTIAVYVIAGAIKMGHFLGIHSLYDILTILRICTALASFFVFNCLTIYLLQHSEKIVLFSALLLLNFSWCYPYTRTLVSAEMWGSILFGLGLLFFFKAEKINTWWLWCAVGFVLGISFYVRFQLAFAIAGVMLWSICYLSNPYRCIYLICVGFGAGIIINIGLDAQYYNEWVFTPYRYFYANIIEGKASSFGKNSPLYYIVELLFVVGAPLMSIILCLYFYRSLWNNRTHVLTWAFVFFLLGHTLVAHKEERFLIPMFGFIPALLALGFSQQKFRDTFLWKHVIIRYIVLPITIVLNSLFVLIYMIIPHSPYTYFHQSFSTYFSDTNEKVVVYYYANRSIYTNSGGHLLFQAYLNELNPNVTLQAIDSTSTLDQVKGKNAYLMTSFELAQTEDLAKQAVKQYPSLLKSSDLLWSINEKLVQHDFNPIYGGYILIALH